MKPFVHLQTWPEVKRLQHYPQRESALKRTIVTQEKNPPVAVKTTDEAIILQVELPGINAKDIDLQVTRDVVTIAVVRPSEPQAGTLYSEFRYGSFQRAIALSEPIVSDRVQAKLTNGLLTLSLPKLKAVRPTVVKVNLHDTHTPPQIENNIQPQPEIKPFISQTKPPIQGVLTEIEDPWAIPTSA